MLLNVRRAGTDQGGEEPHPIARAAEPRAREAGGKQKATKVGIGAGLGAVAAVLVVYGDRLRLCGAGCGTQRGHFVWLSLLIVAGILFLAAAIAAFLAKRSISKASPPTPS